MTILLALALTAFASADFDTRTISYADLDLRKPHDRAVLDQRIRRAVASACASESALDPEGNRAVRQCRATLRAQASRQRDIAVARATAAPVEDRRSRTA